MFANWQLVTLCFVYIGLLFYIAYWGDKHRHLISDKFQPIIYALTLGVYCTSWSFLGTTGQASNNFLSHLPIYLGPILLFVFAWPLLQRIIDVSIKLNLTSIADLLAARFGKSHNLAIVVTIVALIGTLPYLALQLKAIVYSFQQLQVQPYHNDGWFGLIVAFVLAIFTIMFGIRQIDVTERHPGAMLAIAFESLVKLAAFAVLGIFAVFFLFDSPMDLWVQTQANERLDQQLTFPNLTSLIAMLIIVAAAFLSLPRQFQVMVVELKDKRHTKLSRKVFPLYLTVFALFAIPLGLAGNFYLGDNISSDAYVLFLPSVTNQYWLTLLAFLGAISAASSMVIISAIALSTMISNEIVFPHLFRKQDNHAQEFESFQQKLLNIRKSIVLVIIMLGYSVFLLTAPETLSSLGEIAFGAFAQLTPALLAAFYWRSANLIGVYAGIIVGFMLWLILNFMPQMGVYPQPFSEVFMPATTDATLISLGANVLLMWLVSQISRQSVQERVQAAIFIKSQDQEEFTAYNKRAINVNELEVLVSRFVGEQKAKQSFAAFAEQHGELSTKSHQYYQALLQHTEQTLASVMGTQSAQLVLTSAIEGRDIALDELAQLVEDASSQRQQFSQNLVQSAIEHASEGISIIDNELKLVAWNKKYLTLFNYPEALIYVGCDIATLIRYNVERGLCGPGEVEEHVTKRINHLKKGTQHSSERTYANGQVIRIEGNPLPNGGFVMMFSDITAYREAERVLKDANTDLEVLVNERTVKLAQTNDELAKAREKAEQAHRKKSLYLKACSHDLMQPLEAARLFTEALSHQSNLTAAQYRQVKNIDASLRTASDLISDLAEIARIESGNIKPNFQAFALVDLFEELQKEFSMLAQQYYVAIKIVNTSLWVYSDKFLLRRMVQNLLGNALRYASPGRVLLGVKRQGQHIAIHVIDNGPGIAQEQQQAVFEQFTQLHDTQESAKGLGLGLNITQGIGEIIKAPIALQSIEGKGANFSILVERATPRVVANTSPITSKANNFSGVTVLCVDDDHAVLNGMVELLTAWQCKVIACHTREQAVEAFAKNSDMIDIVLADYQLSPIDNGLSVIAELRDNYPHYLPAILLTAANEDGIEDKADEADVGFMRKVVKPASLRAMMSAMLAKKLSSNYGN
ncbi:PAS-domain containing protein [Thalassotalea sp. LPB0316]|uniref:hybrid sensor histidine kinase/response regulator n=1 Tax=Thalassotalea sp. LPB0316 TaxID=2769490 RepID=UPI001865DEA0|nr:PAS-domain containing protein [Thalassotalea sp. LPB0316]QOL25111.1 PAS-domain containing protein [Thalassotalea sp. LPB0316]